MSEKGLRKRPNEWRGAPADYSAYAPNPHVAPDFWSLLSPVQEKLVKWLMGQGQQQPDQSWSCGIQTYAKMARANRHHWTTAKRAIRELQAKKSLEARAVWARNREGGRRKGTYYTIPSFANALERRRAIPDAAVTAGGALLCIGRAKRIVTQELAAQWAIDLAKLGPAKKTAPASVTHARVPRNAPVAEMAPPAAAAIADEAAVLKALLEHCPANAADARDVLAAARGAVATVPVDVVIEQIGEIRARKARFDAKRNERNPYITPKWFIDRMPSHVQNWLTAEQARAREIAREARVARDARLNRLAATIVALQRLGDADGESVSGGLTERQYREQQLAEADPAELEQARALVADTKTRTA